MRDFAPVLPFDDVCGQHRRQWIILARCKMKLVISHRDIRQDERLVIGRDRAGLDERELAAAIAVQVVAIDEWGSIRKEEADNHTKLMILCAANYHRSTDDDPALAAR